MWKVVALAAMSLVAFGGVKTSEGPSGLLFYNGRSEDSGYQIGVATEEDGRFTPQPDPLFVPGNWDSDHVKDPYIVKRNGMLFLYYAGHDGAAYSIGLATSSNGTEWARRDAPVITYEGGAWFPVARGRHLWFGTPDGIAYATTDDGITYTTHGIVLDGLLPGAIRKRAGVFHLFYSVRPQDEWPVGDEIHLATFTDPLGDYRERGMLLEPSDDDSIYSGALTMRDVERSTEGFIGYGTAFHFTEELREVSVVFTAKRLRGPWRICRRCGTLLPLDGGWDAIAAENPNYLRLP